MKIWSKRASEIELPHQCLYCKSPKIERQEHTSGRVRCPRCGKPMAQVARNMLTVARTLAVYGFDVLKAESYTGINGSDFAFVAIVFGKSYDGSFFEDLPHRGRLRYIPFYVGEGESVILFDCFKSQYSGIFGLIEPIEAEKRVKSLLLDWISEKDPAAVRAVLTLMGCGL